MQPNNDTSVQNPTCSDRTYINTKQKAHGKSTQFLAGVISGATTRIVTAPLDMLKIRFQLQITHNTTPLYTNLWTAIKQIYKEEGIRTFWRGNAAALILYMSYGGVQFAIYHGLAGKLTPIHYGDKNTKDGTLEHLFRGAFAGCFATAFTYPFDWSRTRFAAQGIPRVYTSIYNLVQHEVKQYGLRVVYDGLFPTLLAVGPNVALTFALYEAFRPRQDPHKNQDELPTHTTAIAGASAGLIAKLTTYPLDTMKKRMQIARMHRHTYFGEVPKYDTFWKSVRTIWQQEGPTAFYRGLKPAVIKVIPSTAVAFWSYETAACLLQSLDHK